MVEWEKWKEKVKSPLLPFLRFDGKSGEKVIVIGGLVYELKTKFGERLAVLCYDIHEDSELRFWLVPNSFVSEHIDRLQEIDKDRALFKVKIKWLGEGKSRRYDFEVLEISNEEGKKFAELVQKEAKRNQLLQQLVEKIENDKETKTEDKTEKLLKFIKSQVEWLGELPYPSVEIVEKWGYNFEDFNKIIECLNIKKKGKKKVIVGVKC